MNYSQILDLTFSQLTTVMSNTVVTYLEIVNQQQINSNCYYKTNSPTKFLYDLDDNLPPIRKQMIFRCVPRRATRQLGNWTIMGPSWVTYRVYLCLSGWYKS